MPSRPDSSHKKLVIIGAKYLTRLLTAGFSANPAWKSSSGPVDCQHFLLRRVCNGCLFEQLKQELPQAVGAAIAASLHVARSKHFGLRTVQLICSHG